MNSELDLQQIIQRLKNAKIQKQTDINRIQNKLGSIPTTITQDYFIQETTNLVKDILAYEKYDISQIKPILRANQGIYLLLYQNKAHINKHMKLLIEDILLFTDKAKMSYMLDFYCYTWQVLIDCMIIYLEGNHWRVYSNETSQKIKDCIVVLEERAK